MDLKDNLEQLLPDELEKVLSFINKLFDTKVNERLTNQEYQKEYYKELQEQIYSMYPKSDYASIRKSINQFIKLGFIKPFFKGYHTLTKKFLNTTVQEEKRSILGF